MINESAIKQAFSKVREDFELLRRELTEIKSKNNGTSDIQDLKTKLEELKTQLTEVVSPETVYKTNSTKQKKEVLKEIVKPQEVISAESIQVSEE